jgi:hypothetical protein
MVREESLLKTSPRGCPREKVCRLAARDKAIDNIARNNRSVHAIYTIGIIHQYRGDAKRPSQEP